MKTIGISCFFHDAAVAAIQDGEILFAMQEERLTRRKHDASFPAHALHAALRHCGWDWADVDLVVFHETPWLKADRLMHQARMDWPRSLKFWLEHIPYHAKHKSGIEDQMESLGYTGRILTAGHHWCHAASTFFTSPFEDALVLVLDGVGEWDTTTIWQGRGNELVRLKSLRFPHSLGLFYAAMTSYLGFRPNNGEFKVMGLAAYGKPRPFLNRLLRHVILLQPDGSFQLNMKFFNFCDDRVHYTPALIDLLHEVSPRRKNDKIDQRHMDLAYAVQAILEKALFNLLSLALKQTNVPSRWFRNLCMAGGVALNCVASAKFLRTFPYVNLWVQPAAGDAGCALGAAMLGDLRHRLPAGTPSRFRVSPKSETRRYWKTPYLGSVYPPHIIRAATEGYGRKVMTAKDIARKLASAKIVAIYQGRDEWGNRALGNRTILADPRPASTKDYVNAHIKYREAFRPFAPIVMAEHAGDWFESFANAPDMSAYMMLTHKATFPERVPAVVHVNGQSRIQTVTHAQNALLYDILREFYFLTGVPCLLNTSFNLRGESIVSSPSDAVRTFEDSGIDILLFGRWFAIEKER